MVWSNFRSHFTKKGRLEEEEEHVNCLVDQLSLNGEYISTFRTESYTKMLKKAHIVKTKILNRLCSSTSSSSSSIPRRVHLCDYLLEPRQETLLEMSKNSNLHPLVIGFVHATFAACKICELLLCNLDQFRANYGLIQRVIKLTKNTHPYDTGSSVPKSLIRATRIRQTNYLRSSSSVMVGSELGQEINSVDIKSIAYANDDQCCIIFENLASFAMLKNPLLSIISSQFCAMHDSHGDLLQKLKKMRRNVKRRAKFTRCCKETIAGLGLMVSYTAVAITLIVLAVHSMIVLVAAPPVVASALGLVHMCKKWIKRRLKTSSLERLHAQLDIATKGVYVLINYFDTMSRLVRRLEHEIEHIRIVSDVCVRNGKMEVVKEVVREFGSDEKWFLEQLEELEKQIFLCFLNINRSRMLVVEEIMILQQEYR